MKRVEPKASSETVLTENEWKTLFFYFNKTNQLPEAPPTADQALVWLARLGGFLARKNDGEPGPTALWRGWSRLQDMVAISEITLSLK